MKKYGKLAVMPPYFFPYIGYFQLLHAVDLWIMYDNIEFTKGKYHNRNFLVFNGKREVFTVNLKKTSDFAMIGDREISLEYRQKTCNKILSRIQQNYRKAPYFNEVFPWVKDVFEFPDNNLFNFADHSVKKVAEYLGIKTEIITSSSIDIDHSLRNKYRLFEFCKHFNIQYYLNPEGGVSLYNKEEFAQKGIDLHFHYAHQPEYHQIHSEKFEPYLSIIDIMMHCSVSEIQEILNDYHID